MPIEEGKAAPAFTLPDGNGNKVSLRDFAGKNAEFSTQVALLALSGLLNGAVYDPDPANVRAAYDYLMAGTARIGAESWVREQVAKLASGPCSPGREDMRQSLVNLLERVGRK